MRENCKAVRHCYELWHVAKSFKKVQAQLAKKENTPLRVWRKVMITHLYCVINSTSPQQLEAMWLSMELHMRNEHTSFPWPEYSRCPHGPSSQRGEMAWIETGSPAADSLSALVHISKLINDMKCCCAVGDTSDMEAFHSLLNHYYCKVTHVRSCAMLSRTLLAVMDFNENAAGPQAVGRNGKPINVKATRKYCPGEASKRSVKSAKLFKFVNDLKVLFGISHCDFVLEPDSATLTSLTGGKSALPCDQSGQSVKSH